MTRRVVLLIFLTTICWVGVSLLSVGGSWANLLHHLWQAGRSDEELIAFSCFLLFGLSAAVHLVALGWKTTYRQRFLWPEFGLLYAVAALVIGNILRHLFRQPAAMWFHLVFTVGAVGGFAAVFGRRYARILKHGNGSQPVAHTSRVR